jgi:hypothetical protein
MRDLSPVDLLFSSVRKPRGMNGLGWSASDVGYNLYGGGVSTGV